MTDNTATDGHDSDADMWQTGHNERGPAAAKWTDWPDQRLSAINRGGYRDWRQQLAAATAQAECQGAEMRGDRAAIWTESQRVGEAANPGPAARSVGAAPRRRLIAPDGVTINYPVPDREGFRDFVAPGYALQRPEPPRRLEDFRLCVESAHTTGWNALERRPRSTEAHVLLVELLESQGVRQSSGDRNHGRET